eukprot:CAMPEP_0113645882 /NCGR_PEP_ID=MMETSP0017_2-20120614/24204_1 /TAXON_ID=2856 /ORGANISM="Cylindrotheca closterium" /LENGTH=326 /DNA_ID=CAMNT_0000557681 /DNA_START=153 /DNA_END=1129 /DNA_ORIENTATION=- /assembly_acc=CAM_ASM_000147
MEHGVSEHSMYAIATIGIGCRHESNDYPASKYLAEITLILQKKLGQINQAATMHTLYHGLLPWTEPIHTCGDGLHTGYLSGIRNGESEYAVWCLLNHALMVPWTMGAPIEQMLAECPKIMVQSKQLGHTVAVVTNQCFWQMLLNLRYPKCSDPTKLQGEIFNPETLKGNDNFFVSQIHLAECRLMLVYDRPALAKVAIACRDLFFKLNPISFQVMGETFDRGVALFATARHTKNRLKRRKYIRNAKKIHSTIKSWEKAGNPNVFTYRILLDAEQAALYGKRKKAEDSYKNAIIVLVARAGHLHHAALFNELYAEYLYQGCNDEEEA